jgi:tellurite resistance protein TerC
MALTPQQISYIVFGIVIILALVFDLGLLSKKNAVVTIKKALTQTIFWVTLALGFGIFVWFEDGPRQAVEYLSAYLMEWSLSIDNIFVFILIFTFFGIKEKFYGRLLLIGILMAILLRIIFISVGIVLIERFSWVLWIFGAILLWTGIKMFTTKHDEEPDLSNNRVYKFLQRVLPLTHEDGNGTFVMHRDGKKYYTILFVAVIMLATTDILFALDSIPAVFAITQERLIVYTSNIFAVLGLRSLFFLLKGAVNKFAYLQQGIAIVLVFIGLKMLAEIIHIKIPSYISLLVIVLCIGVSILYSAAVAKKETDQDMEQKDLH